MMKQDEQQEGEYELKLMRVFNKSRRLIEQLGSRQETQAEILDRILDEYVQLKKVKL